jgi:putative transposase
MSYNPNRHHRRSIRLQGYDYTQAGVYFLTLCIQGRECILGEIASDAVRLSPFGLIVQNEWLRTAEIRREVELDAFIVMPNHFHAIVVFTNSLVESKPVGAHGMRPDLDPRRDQGAHRAPLHSNDPHPRLDQGAHRAPLHSHRKPKSLGSLVAGFKASVTRQINLLRNTSSDTPVWQRNYYEHIIRNEESLNRIRTYIENNPISWS